MSRTIYIENVKVTKTDMLFGNRFGVTNISPEEAKKVLEHLYERYYHVDNYVQVSPFTGVCNGFFSVSSNDIKVTR